MHKDGDITATVLDGTHRRIWPLKPCERCAELLANMKRARDYSPGYGLVFQILDDAIRRAERK